MSTKPESTSVDSIIAAPAKRILPHILLLIVILIGAALRLRGIDQRSVWNDEGLSLAFIRLPLAQFHHALVLDVHPPLYYWALRLWMGLWYNITWARVLSALCSILTLPLVWLLARKLVRGHGGAIAIPLLATAFLAFSPQAVHYAQEIRMYALQGLLVTALMLTAIHYFDSPQITSLIASTILAALVCYTHYFSGVFVIGFLVVLPSVRKQHEQSFGPAILRTALVALAACVLYLPWLSTGFAHLMSNSKGGLYQSFQGGLTLSSLRMQSVEAFLGLMPSFPLDRILFPGERLYIVRGTLSLLFAIVLLALSATGAWRLWRVNLARQFTVSFLIIPLLLAVLFQLLGGRFYPRFYLPLLPAIFILASVAIVHFPRVWESITAGLAILSVLLSSSLGITSVDLRDVSREAYAYLSQAAPPNAPVLHASAHSFWDLRAYDPNPSRHLLLNLAETPALAREIYGPGVMINQRDLSKISDIWVVYAEWRAGVPALRHQLEPRYFGPEWHITDEPVLFSRFVKKIEIVHYQRGS